MPATAFPIWTSAPWRKCRRSSAADRISASPILTYEQSLFDDKLDLKGGWFNVGDDFATSPLYCYFQNNAFCGNPVSVTLDAGFSTFPVSSWGGIVKFQPRSDVYLQAGAYEVNPSLNNSSNGFKMNTAGATGVIVPLEAGWAPEKGIGGLPAHLTIGGYYDNSASARSGRRSRRSRDTHVRPLGALCPGGSDDLS